MDNECPICYESILGVNDELITVCKHRFHEQCIVTWWKKLKRNQCPYCRHWDNNKKDLIFSLEHLINKLAECQNVHDMSIENLRKEIVTMTNRWYYRRAINFILSNDESLEETINQALESLISRGYLKIRNDLYYVVY